MAKSNKGTAGCASLFILLMIISLIYKALPYIAIVAVIALLIYWWIRAKKQKNIEIQNKEDILKIPLEKFGGDEAEELAKKYEKEERLNKTKDNNQNVKGKIVELKKLLDEGLINEEIYNKRVEELLKSL